jgi:hypothetical protein
VVVERRLGGPEPTSKAERVDVALELIRGERAVLVEGRKEGFEARDEHGSRIRFPLSHDSSRLASSTS